MNKYCETINSLRLCLINIYAFSILCSLCNNMASRTSWCLIRLNMFSKSLVPYMVIPGITRHIADAKNFFEKILSSIYCHLQISKYMYKTGQFS